MSKNLLLLFTRHPELGKCKTRLAQKIGDQKALEVYSYLLQHTANVTKNINAEKQVWYATQPLENDIWNPRYYTKKAQQGENLGARMAYAFAEGFQKGYNKILILGSDLIDLNAARVEDAFTKLDETDFVLGPAEDGGYYLLGMKSFRKEIFENKNWSTPSVFNDTLSSMGDKSVTLLETLNDIDEYEDMQKHPTLMNLL
ncbi:TIGR04282 family arsenosugar biosynthesis glycosyltransferase [Mesonia sp. MT50]|uniref:TIGR04282 family arsenosugar biosynthesis glycosyltransferase n=1 Tax=Mesonia profundi TaxID=3070998 RepID=A0ABU0ZY05_9FLAO|nr:TIGR04282 family arsenosugar biosynthesis glycosyltransferase [Mesonia profundi]MDQ7916287.1 TIGR04282 family arsenosugar biosynthesis glycosyltransferase [Mesonia profundi]